MEKTRKIYRGISKSSFKNRQRYYFREAMNILGPCKRKEITYLEQEQIWQEIDRHRIFDIPQSDEWCNKGTPKILEKYDVWLNERGDMLLAIPLPENTLNIKDFDL